MRRFTVLLVGAGMAALMLAMAGMALAAPGRPAVVSTFPADEATGVSLDANIKVKFSEPMRARTVNELTFHMYPTRYSYADLNQDPNTCPPEICIPSSISATVSYNVEKRLAILNPDQWLETDTTYTVKVEGARDFDVQAVKDKDGQATARDYIFHFTSDSGPPSCPGCGGG